MFKTLFAFICIIVIVTFYSASQKELNQITNATNELAKTAIDKALPKVASLSCSSPDVIKLLNEILDRKS